MRVKQKVFRSSWILFLLILPGVLVPARPQGGTTFARSDFRDFVTDPATGATTFDRIRSDGNFFPCGYDYVNLDDLLCADSIDAKNSRSTVLSQRTYFLRTLANHTPNPTRWLVLDFSAPADINSPCHNLDQILAKDSPNYPGTRDPNANSPTNNIADPCVDSLEVRFFADKAFANGAVATPVSIIIDGPDSVKTKQGTRLQWNAKYSLDFVNPLKVTRVDNNTAIVETVGTLDTAELWTLNSHGENDQLLGTYHMPFRVVITRLQ